MEKIIEVSRDAWSDGQMRSKLWLAESLEIFKSQYFGDPQRIWILGGWYGLLSQILFVRGKMNIEKVVSFDIDPSVKDYALAMNNQWDIEGRFQAFTEDCNRLNYQEQKYGSRPTLIFNTSCEHFDGLEWWNNIPQNTWVVLQSTNMEHATHIRPSASLEDFKNQFPEMKTIIAAKTLKVEYPSFHFERYMLIGKK